MPTAIAFLSFGRWVADCPYDDCTNARLVTPGETRFTCVPPPTEGGCGRSAPLTWPDNIAATMASVSGLPAGQQSETVPGSPQQTPVDTSGDTGHDDPIPQPDDGNPDSWKPVEDDK